MCRLLGQQFIHCLQIHRAATVPLASTARSKSPPSITMLSIFLSFSAPSAILLGYALEPNAMGAKRQAAPQVSQPAGPRPRAQRAARGGDALRGGIAYARTAQIYRSDGRAPGGGFAKAAAVHRRQPLGGVGDLEGNPSVGGGLPGAGGSLDRR